MFSFKFNFKNIVVLTSLLLLQACTTFKNTTTSYTSTASAETLNINIIKQSGQFSCGAAVLSSALNYWGVELSEADILTKHPPQHETGYTVRELRDIARQNGLKSYGIKGSAQIIEKELSAKRPSIVLIKKPLDPYESFLIKPPGFITSLFLEDKFLDHYWVVAGRQGESFIIADPSSGVQHVPKAELMTYWEKNGFSMIVLSK